MSTWPEPHKTTFAAKELGELRGMLAGADPEKVRKNASSWDWIYKVLVGAEDGGLKKEFDKAVEEVLEHWTGEAADGFRKRAHKISKKISEAASRAKIMHAPMENVAAVLQTGITQLNDVKDASVMDRGLDATGNAALSTFTLGIKGGRDDSGANADIAAGVPTQEVLNRHATELSEGKERALKAAMVLEYVAGGYRTYTKTIQQGRFKANDPNFDPSGYEGGIPTVLPFGGGGLKQASVTPNSMPSGLDGPGYAAQTPLNTPRPEGISGGIGAGGPGSQVGTGLNSATTGLNSGGGINTGAPVGGLSASGPAPTGGTGGVGAVGPLGTPSGSGLRGTGAGARGAGGVGRAGMPGMGGGAGAGTGAKGAKGGSRGALAKQRGGVVGAAGKGAPRAQGGAGLHRSRGGKQTGTGQGRRGMMAAPGARGAAGQDDKERKERPDYLVEDEETWVPDKKVTPKVID